MSGVEKIRWFCPQCGYQEFDDEHPLSFGKIKPCPNGCVVDAPQFLFSEDIPYKEVTK